jgi:transcriptional regulator with XRE-family HTH domain
MTTMNPIDREATRRAALATSLALAGTQALVNDAWRALLGTEGSGRVVGVRYREGYGPMLPHVGSSSSVVDRRAPAPGPMPTAPQAPVARREVASLSTADQLDELLAALSLSKSQLAQVLRVTRPTLYDWFQGNEPNAVNTARIHALLRLLERASISGERPLDARFVRQVVGRDQPPLLDLLSEGELDEERVHRMLLQVRALGTSARHSREAREERLRRLGFEEPSQKQRRAQLADSMALKDWPR